jgi:ABC-type uncharacterized transport system involved in gliding motility auxiliary subunit
MDWKKIFASRAVTLTLIALATVFAIHVIAQNAEHVRLDMTADDLYSLSDGTLAILEKMREEGVKPIEIKLFFSETAGKTLPRFVKQFITYESYLESLLKELEVAGQGKIKVSFFDPVPDSDEAQDAEEYGLDGKPINQEGDVFFFGLVLETQTGSRDKIEFLWPNQQETVEYEIVKRLHGLIWPTRKRVGVLAGLEVLSEAEDPYMRQVLAAQGRSPRDSWISMQLLQEQYEVSRIDSDTDHISTDEYDLVIVAHPKNLGKRVLWALDEWVQRSLRHRGPAAAQPPEPVRAVPARPVVEPRAVARQVGPRAPRRRGRGRPRPGGAAAGAATRPGRAGDRRPDDRRGKARRDARRRAPGAQGALQLAVFHGREPGGDGREPRKER